MRYTIVEKKRARERKKESENPNSFSLVLTCNIRDIFSIFFVFSLSLFLHKNSLSLLQKKNYGSIRNSEPPPNSEIKHDEVRCQHPPVHRQRHVSNSSRGGDGHEKPRNRSGTTDKRHRRSQKRRWVQAHSRVVETQVSPP